MNSSEPPTKKYKRPKQNTHSTTNPDLNKAKRPSDESLQGSPSPPLCPLLAKDSEWVDLLQSSHAETSRPPAENQVEEVLQLVECENGPGMKPLAIMFPDLVNKDPGTLEGVLTKAMSTTEVTKHLVDLKQKANFTSMKKSIRLIPREKIWLESLTENTNSISSLPSPFSSQSSEYEADVDTTEDEAHTLKYRIKRRATILRTPVNPEVEDLTKCIETPELEESVASEKNAAVKQEQRGEIKPPNLRIRKSTDLNNLGQSKSTHRQLSLKEVIESKRADSTSSEENASCRPNRQTENAQSTPDKPRNDDRK